MAKRTSIRESFYHLSKLPDAEIDLLEGYLLISADHQKDINVRTLTKEIEELACYANRYVAKHATCQMKAASLLHFLFVEQGFTGNEENYYQPENSLLPSLMSEKKGIPVSLGALYLILARKLGFRLHGVNFPSHFLLRSEETSEVFIDPYYGELLTLFDCEERFRDIWGDESSMSSRDIARASTRDVLARILRNLKYCYAKKGDYRQALSCSQKIILLQPNDALEFRDRGIFFQQLECFSAALDDFERYLSLAPYDHEAPEIRGLLPNLKDQVEHLH